MKVTSIYLYPIKGLRAITLLSSPLTPQGLLHDRTFMLCRVLDDGSYQKLQLDKFPRCARFSQELVTENDQEVVRVRWLGETEVNEQLIAEEEGHTLDVPLHPAFEELEKTVMNLHQSKVHAYLMPKTYNDFFTKHFGFITVLLYIGDGKRPVLGTLSPKTTTTSSGTSSWFPSITNLFTTKQEADWLTFTDCAPFLLATNASLKNVHQRFDSGVEIDMYKFRPNIVLSGEEDAPFDEDFWQELSLEKEGTQAPLFTLSKMCNRCTSLNVDYETGAMATGEPGNLLKKLTKDRRVDPGNKWSPVFGRYAFLSDEMVRKGKEGDGKGVVLEVGDEIEVTGRNEERPTWDWPTRDERFARFYDP